MPRIEDLENYFDVRIVPMNHKGEVIGGKRRELYLHKKYFPLIEKFFDDLAIKRCNDEREENKYVS